MTICREILIGISKLDRMGHKAFSRSDVRDVLGIENRRWQNSYNPTFQGMREDRTIEREIRYMKE